MDINKIEVNGEVFPVEDLEARNSITALNNTIAEQNQTIENLQEQINAKKTLLYLQHYFSVSDTSSQTWDITEYRNSLVSGMMIWRRSVSGPTGGGAGIVTTSMSPGLKVDVVAGNAFIDVGITVGQDSTASAKIFWTPPSGFVGNGVTLYLWIPEK